MSHELEYGKVAFEELVLQGIWHIISLLLCFFANKELGIIPELVVNSAKKTNGKISTYLTAYYPMEGTEHERPH